MTAGYFFELPRPIKVANGTHSTAIGRRDFPQRPTSACGAENANMVGGSSTFCAPRSRLRSHDETRFQKIVICVVKLTEESSRTYVTAVDRFILFKTTHAACRRTI